MADDDITGEGVLEQFEQKLTPCIERGDLDACVKEATRLAVELGIEADKLMGLAAQMDNAEKYEFAYVLALGAVDGLDGSEKAGAYFYAGLAAQSLGNVDKAEIHYLKSIELDPDYAVTHYNYANLCEELGNKGDAAIYYLKAIELDPNYVMAHNNYANLLKEHGNKEDAAIHYIKTIELDPNYAVAHYNYANLLKEVDEKEEAVINYKKAIKLDPKNAAAHYNYANLLQELNEKDMAAIHYLEAIKIYPKFAKAHGTYGYLLIDYGKRNEAISETELASKLFKEAGHITRSYLAKALFYQRYSEKYLSRKEYLKSSADADKASDEYFKAAETVEGDLRESLTLQGNVLKAKFFMRKVPQKPWYDKIYRIFGKKPNISEFIYNLQNAAIWYQKASVCEISGKRDVCGACHLGVSVFSEVLGAMSTSIKGNKAEINKDRWLSSLDLAREIYANTERNKGVALVDSVKQLVTCVDELAKHKVSGLKPQADRLGECYNSLLEVNRHLEGALQVQYFTKNTSTSNIFTHLRHSIDSLTPNFRLTHSETRSMKMSNLNNPSSIVGGPVLTIVKCFF